jgi:hypothetical protein
MHRMIVLPVVILMFVSLSLAQSAPAATPPPPAHHPMDNEHMAEMHKQHMDAMKADLDKMKASLEQMKANVSQISNAEEKARWQSNIDLWTAMIGHMEQMMKHMEHMGGMGMMGPGMHHDHMGAPPSTPPDQKKPE